MHYAWALTKQRGHRIITHMERYIGHPNSETAPCCPSLLSSQQAPWEHSDFPACGNCWSARSVLSWCSLTWKGNGCSAPNVAHKSHRCHRLCATHYQWKPGVAICKTYTFFLTSSAVITDWWAWRGSAFSGPLWLVDIRCNSSLRSVYVICQAGPPPVKRHGRC